MNRKCKKCNKIKLLSEFYKHKYSLLGYSWICKSCHNENCKKYYSKEISKIRSRFVYFGGNKDNVLKRDNYSCVKCGMTDKDHRIKYGKEITVDHINGGGRYSKIKNHSMDNLQTLCLSCHGRKDTFRRKHYGSGAYKGQPCRNNFILKTHCYRGHPYDVKNTYTSPQGVRDCKICREIRRVRYDNKI